MRGSGDDDAAVRFADVGNLMFRSGRFRKAALVFDQVKDVGLVLRQKSSR